jgi:hypothetical protein
MSKPMDAGADQSPGTAAEVTHEDAGRLHDASSGRLIAILVTLVLFGEFVPLQYTMVGVIIPKIGAAFPSAGNSTSWALTIVGVVGAAVLVLAGRSRTRGRGRRVLREVPLHPADPLPPV